MAHSRPPGQRCAPAEAQPQERVWRGLLASLVAVLAGIVLTVVIWRLGYVAALTSLVIAAGAVYLYSWAAGAPPRKGLGPLIVVVALGVVASDLAEAYDEFDLGAAGISKLDFVTDNLFHAEVLREYGKDAAMFAVFAVLGVFGTLRRLIAGAR